MLEEYKNWVKINATALRYNNNNINNNINNNMETKVVPELITFETTPVVNLIKPLHT